MQQAIRSCELMQQAIRSCELIQRCRRCQRAQTILSCDFLGQTPQRWSPMRHADVVARTKALLNPVHSRATRLATAMCPGRPSTPSASADQQAMTRVPLVKGTQKNRHGGSTSGMPPHELTLAPGALIMLLRNLDAAECGFKPWGFHTSDFIYARNQKS